VNKISLIQFELERKMKSYNDIEDQELKAKHSSDTMREVTILSTNTIAETIQSITTSSAVVDNKEYIIDFLKNCDVLTYETIRKQVVELRESSEMKPLKMKCINCSHEYQQPLAFNVSDFFG
jgi:L-asparaginase/Glu-tRNA(Gln) amidotransferase subunit D